MKNSILILTIAFSVCTLSCKKSSEITNTEAAKNGIEATETSKTGNFSFDGKTFSAPVETQYFGDKVKGNFSVMSQHNESDDPQNVNFELLQVIFNSENDAQSSPLKIYDGGSTLPMTEPEPGIVAVSLTGVGNGLDKTEFTGTGKSTGTISVKDKTVTLKDLVLFNDKGEQKVINATLPY